MKLLHRVPSELDLTNDEWELLVAMHELEAEAQEVCPNCSRELEREWKRCFICGREFRAYWHDSERIEQVRDPEEKEKPDELLRQLLGGK